MIFSESLTTINTYPKSLTNHLVFSKRNPTFQTAPLQPHHGGSHLHDQTNQNQAQRARAGIILLTRGGRILQGHCGGQLRAADLSAAGSREHTTTIRDQGQEPERGVVSIVVLVVAVVVVVVTKEQRTVYY